MPTSELEAPRKKQVVLIASGDLRLPANRQCWPAQRDMEKKLVPAIRREGWTVKRAHPYKKTERHGFIASQKEGMEIFRSIHPDSPLIVAEAVWQFSHHVLPGLITHRGPILTIANWSGQSPGLVGMLNLNGSLTKAGVDFSTLWSKNFTDSFFRQKLGRWLDTGRVSHDTSHVRSLDTLQLQDASADWHSVSAGTEGHLSGVRPRRGIAQQCGWPATRPTTSRSPMPETPLPRTRRSLSRPL